MSIIYPNLIVFVTCFVNNRGIVTYGSFVNNAERKKIDILL